MKAVYGVPHVTKRFPWVRLVGTRLFSGGLLLLGLSLLCFLLLELAPGDFLTGSALDPQWSQNAQQSYRERVGLSLPFWERYGKWLSGLARGEMGMSYSYGVDSATLLLPRLWRTAMLNASAMALAIGLAAPLALYAAHRPRFVLSRALEHGAQVLLTIPEIALTLLLVAAAIRWGVPLPGGQPTADVTTGWWAWSHSMQGIATPCVALTCGAFPVFFRHLQSAIAQALQAPYVQAARQLGLPSTMLYLRYVAPAAASPLLALFGLSLGGMFSASLVVETITSWPGLGPLMLEAVLARDSHVVVGGVLVSGLSLLLGNLLADIGLLRLDARIRR